MAGWFSLTCETGTVVTQIVFDPSASTASHQLAEQLRSEYVLQVRGLVRARPEGQANPNLDTGDVEVLAKEAQILNEAKTPVFDLSKDVEVDEKLRLRYRYLDLRRPRMLAQPPDQASGGPCDPRVS